jgi:hypothetical protein
MESIDSFETSRRPVPWCDNNYGNEPSGDTKGGEFLEEFCLLGYNAL